MKARMLWMAAAMVAAALPAAPKKPAEESPLERYIREAMKGAAEDVDTPAPGSAYAPGGRLTGLFADLRAGQVHDVVTILVADRASAVTSGTTSTSRASSAEFGVGAIFGRTNPANALANLARVRGQTELDAQGSTSRANALTTTLSGRVTHVLPNGNLVVEGAKEIVVNSERQLVTVRGVVRPFDLTTANTVRSDRIAMMEVKISGRGVVGDAIRRPFFLYRLLLGLLPF